MLTSRLYVSAKGMTSFISYIPYFVQITKPLGNNVWGFAKNRHICTSSALPVAFGAKDYLLFKIAESIEDRLFQILCEPGCWPEGGVGVGEHVELGVKLGGEQLIDPYLPGRFRMTIHRWSCRSGMQ